MNKILLKPNQTSNFTSKIYLFFFANLSFSAQHSTAQHRSKNQNGELNKTEMRFDA